MVEQTVVIKLNGGLGTSMGLDTVKSLLPVRGELTFLDLILRQVEGGTEASAIDPVASMVAIDNDALHQVAGMLLT